ncbi:MAG: DNA recombination protein RmuC [Candidatus Spechtbacteria bacterium SB0662_bin_43]|uniref:DNA recombination protein RmuC n=1 Tax=Candidatus Spechtbacteria bacterium SB0662_bin_43 TaxID=2604897 RepID=A0A845D850_9BACT|nr:DNA recombination protein RmuC [Candidatus Spechtbacteria bacterium SB0662_bin_43]
MDSLIVAIILAVACVIVLGIVVVFLVRLYSMMSRLQDKKDDSSGLLFLQNQVNEMQRTLDKRLQEANTTMQKSVTDITKNVLDSTRKSHDDVQRSMKGQQDLMHDQMKSSQRLIRTITEELTEVKKGNQQVVTIADQLKNLEQVLKNQKQRGNLGEAGLELVLSNILPPEVYAMQYAFQNGEIVDAIIRTKDGIIPVDAKFPLENYTRLLQEKDDASRKLLERQFRNDVKGRIDETAKYIRTNEGTLPFAFMFLPAEGIYYDLFINEVGGGASSRNLLEYAYRDKNVVIVSPTTFSAYLQSVLYGFRAFQIEERAEQIGRRVEDLGRHLVKYDEYMQKLGKSLGTTVNHYNTSYRELKKIDKDVFRITEKSQGGDIEPMMLDKPQAEE